VILFVQRWPQVDIRWEMVHVDSSNMPVASAMYPTDVEVDTPDAIDRWRPLVQWLLALPHLILMSALSTLMNAVSVIAWFVIVFTGKMPRGLAQLTEMSMRYAFRVAGYALGLVAVYPPFSFSESFEDPRTYPVRHWVEPELEDRNRLTVGLRALWVIPAAVFAALIMIVAHFAFLIGAVMVLFTGSWNETLRDWIVKCLRVYNRLYAYGLLLTDEYPPFTTD